MFQESKGIRHQGSETKDIVKRGDKCLALD